MKTLSLRTRLLILLLGGLGILIGANAWWLGRDEARQVAAGAEAKAAYLLHVLSHHTLPDSRLDLDAATLKIAVLAHDPEIAALVVVDAAGRVLAASRNEWRGESAASHVPDFAGARLNAFRSQLSPRQEFDAAAHTFVAWMPLPPHAGSLPLNDGAIFVAIDVSARQQASEQRVIGQLLRESSIVIICLAVLFVLLARWVVTPLASIRNQVRSFSAGEFQPIDAHGGAREIAEAVEVFNALQVECSDLRQRMFHATLAFEASREGITITDATGRIEQVNPAFTAITGYTAAEAIGQTPRILQSGRQSPEFYAGMWQAIAAQGFWAGEIWNRRKNGVLWPEWLSISAARDEGGHVTHYVGVFTDLSEIKAAESRAEALAWNSPLVGLPNRAFLLERLKEATALIGSGERRGFAVLLLINLRGFQRINASFGIEVGDVVLANAARRIEAIAAGHLTCHLESDEFAVFLNSDISQEEAAHFAAAVLERLDMSYDIEGSQVVLGAAIGIALCPADGLSVSQLMRQADSALDAARHEPGSRYCFASVDLTERARARLDLENRLRHALAANELRVFFQPQVEVRHGRIVGAEALVRWQDPQRGLVAPNEFIPVAEDSGLIIELGRQVLLEACRQGAAWRTAGLPSLKLAVNVAARQWAAPEFVDTVEAVLQQTGYPAGGLVLELTESTLVSGTDAFLPQLRCLREMGIELSIDDFGTGYSSLAYLQHFPVNELKIDKSFVDHLTDRQSDRKIAAAIIALGHAMKLDVLAEGVETAAQLEWLENLGVDRWQGYLKSRPLPAEEFEALLRSQAP
ncbi:MAG: EAL domain-containing protein [Rugosibacter sp.]|nr:EAL domain-containing protein [Rugosibacter sp.]